jgi:predicted PurR-regulated permease PerM
MSKDLNLKSLNLKPTIAKIYKRLGKNVAFGAVLIVLLAYLLVVFRISSLAKAEPGPDQISNTPILIPRVDQQAINQIQSLESTNTEVHSLFEQARNNPFQE